MTSRRSAYLSLSLLVACSLMAIIFLGGRNESPGAQPLAGQNNGQPPAWDEFVRQVREGVVTEQMIADQKEALVREYAQVTPGTASETAYRQHCETLMVILGEDPNRCQIQIASLAPQLPPPGPSPVPTIVATIEPTLSMTDAWGTNVKVETLPLAYGTDYRLGCNTITPDGQYLVCEAMSLDFDSDPSRHGGTRPGKVVLVDVHTHQVTEIHTLARNDTQAFDISTDGQWAVWVEAADVMGNSDAVIYAYNLAKHSLQEVTRAKQVIPNAPPGTIPGPGSPRVARGIIVWVEDALSTSGSVEQVVRKQDLATGQIETSAENAFYPQISWPYISWLQVRESTPQMITYSIVVLNLQTGVKKTLRDPYTPGYLLNGNEILWATRSGEVVLTDVDETFRQVLVRGPYGQTIEGLSINDRLVTWRSYENAQVWDRALSRLVNFPGGGVGYIFLSGNYLVWQPLIDYAGSTPGNTGPGATINVLDTSTLRK